MGTGGSGRTQRKRTPRALREHLRRGALGRSTALGRQGTETPVQWRLSLDGNSHVGVCHWVLPP